MRLAPVFLFWLLVATVLGQTSSGENLFQTTRFEATVVVRKHSSGADLIEVTVLKPSYSHQLLEAQIQRLGQELGSTPRGLQVFDYRLDPGDSGSKMVKASFAVDGLIDRRDGVLRLQPLARAFSLTAGQDKLDALMIQFEGESPTTNTLRSCAPPVCQNVMLQGRSVGGQYGVEYRMKLLAHEPEKISIPDYKKDVKETGLPPAPKPKADWILISLLVVAALAVGALVYSLLSRGRPQAHA